MNGQTHRTGFPDTCGHWWLAGEKGLVPLSEELVDDFSFTISDNCFHLIHAWIPVFRLWNIEDNHWVLGGGLLIPIQSADVAAGLQPWAVSLCCPSGEFNKMGGNTTTPDMSRLDILHSLREGGAGVGGGGGGCPSNVKPINLLLS